MKKKKRRFDKGKKKKKKHVSRRVHYVETDVADSRRDAQHSWPKELCVCVCVFDDTKNSHTALFHREYAAAETGDVQHPLFFFF